MATGVYRDGDTETDSGAVLSWAEKRQAIREEVDRGPCLTEHLCPSDDKRERAIFYKIVKGMLRRREIKYEWYLTWGKGRPSRVLSNRNVERDQLRHEVLLTYVLQALGYEYRRLDDVDQSLLPDAEIIANGSLEFIEMDCGTERGGKIEGRLSAYDSREYIVRWIVMTEERRQSLRAKDQNKNSYFGLFTEVVNNPEGEIWLGIDNQFVTL